MVIDGCPPGMALSEAVPLLAALLSLSEALPVTDPAMAEAKPSTFAALMMEAKLNTEKADWSPFPWYY